MLISFSLFSSLAESF